MTIFGVLNFSKKTVNDFRRKMMKNDFKSKLFDVNWRQISSIFINWRHIWSFDVIFLIKKYFKKLNEKKFQFLLHFIYSESLMTRHVKWRHMTSNDVVRRRKNMTNIICRHSTFVKWRNLMSFFINFRHLTSNLPDAPNTIIFL